MATTESTIKYFIELALSQRAARALTMSGCRKADGVLQFNPECFNAEAIFGRATVGKLRKSVVERRRLPDESGLSINKG